MFSRAPIARNAPQAVRRTCGLGSLQKRAFAAAASSGSFETADVSGLKTASRDNGGPTTKLTVFAKAGTRYEPLPGLTTGLEGFAFKNTDKRSALRITRESELLGGQLKASHTREAIILEAAFLREDLPYFAELLAEVLTQTKYTTHEFQEEVERVLHLKQSALSADASALALDAAHSVAYHTGLGAPIYPTSSAPLGKYLNEEYIASYADAVYSKPNIAIVADGAAPDALSKWTQQFFSNVPATSQSGQSLKVQPSKYYGGEQRTNHAGGNAMVIAFPGSDYTNPKAEVAVLAALLGGKSSVKWSTGFSFLSKTAQEVRGVSAAASNLAYSDAGLLTVQLSGAAASVRKAAEETVKAIKSIAEGSVSKEALTKAIASAKFEALEAASVRDASIYSTGTGLVTAGKPNDTAAVVKAIDAVSAEKLKTAAKAMLDGKATVSTVGDLFVLPFAEEIGLRV